LSIIDDLRSEFSPANHFLNTATVGIPPRRAVEAFHATLDSWADGTQDVVAFDQDVNRARSAFARLAGAEVEDVGIVGQLSVTAAMVAASLPQGARVLYAEEEFTSTIFPFLAAAQAGRIRVAGVPFDRLIDSISEQTDLVAVAAVQSADGRILDLDALAERAGQTGTRTFIDATQAAGWLPIGASRFDVVGASAYKWLLAPRGTGYMALSPSARQWVKPLFPGWYSGDDPWSTVYGAPLRLAPGGRGFQASPDWLSTPAAAIALELLAGADLEEIRRHNVALGNAFCDGVGIPEKNSAIVSITSDVPEERLLAEGVSAAYRGGRLRLSFHLYNTIADVEAVLKALAGS
jgi:selenocysteine lyase/cysteine desulfurase